MRLTTGAVAALREHLERQLEEIGRLGSLYRTGGLVFANETEMATVRRIFFEIASGTPIKMTGPHSLCHSR